MKNRFLKIGILLGTLAAAGSLQAKEFHVATSPELQSALTEAASNHEDDTIYLAAGTYKVSDNSDEKDTGLYFRYQAADDEKFNLSLIGSGADKTILDGEGKARELLIAPTNFQALALQGLTFQNGKANDDDNGGGAVYLISASLSIKDCRFLNNSAPAYYGGALSLFALEKINITNTIFAHNESFRHGTAISSMNFTSPSQVKLYNNIFYSNRFIGKTDNAATHAGAAILLNPQNGSEVDVANNIFFQNISGQEESDFDLRQCPDVIPNRTIALTHVRLFNNNLPAFSNNLFDEEIALLKEEGTQKVDPLFVNAEGGDFHLSPNSSMIDAGKDDIDGLPEKDLDGNPRKIGAHVDIGALEFNSQTPLPSPGVPSPAPTPGTTTPPNPVPVVPGGDKSKKPEDPNRQPKVKLANGGCSLIREDNSE